MCWLYIYVPMHTAFAQRDAMINMELVTLNKLLANAAHTAMHLVDHLRIYLLDKLVKLTCTTSRFNYPLHASVSLRVL